MKRNIKFPCPRIALLIVGLKLAMVPGVCAAFQPVLHGKMPFMSTNQRKRSIQDSEASTSRSSSILYVSREEGLDWRKFRARLVSNEREKTWDPDDVLGSDYLNDETAIEKSTYDTIDSASDSFIHQQYQNAVDFSPSLHSDSWIYNAGDHIEVGTILLHNPSHTTIPSSSVNGSDGNDMIEDSNYNYQFGLNQQWLHKSVILIVEHGEGNNIDRRTTGIILNRPTDLILCEDNPNSFAPDLLDSDNMEIDSEVEDLGWDVWFGGNEFGIHTEHPKFFCLFSSALLEDEENDENDEMYQSQEVLPGIRFCSLQDAKSIVKNNLGRIKPNDFWVFCGFQTWNSDDVANEIQLGRWHAVSADGKLLLQQGWDLLRDKTCSIHEDELEASFSSRCDGTPIWNVWTKMIDPKQLYQQHTSRNSRVNSEASIFCDRMLSEWSNKHLEFDGPPQFVTEHTSEEDTNMQHRDGRLFRVEPGMMIQARNKDVHDRDNHLLTDQYFHRSSILILQDDEEMTIGVIMNMASRFHVDIDLTERVGFDGDNDPPPLLGEEAVSIPLRFGGPLG